jgi:hypothetical protein
MTNRLNLLETLVESLRNTYGHDVLLGVHHSGTTIPKLENSKIQFDAYVTPINRMGVMMFPTRDRAVKAIQAAKNCNRHQTISWRQNKTKGSIRTRLQ